MITELKSKSESFVHVRLVRKYFTRKGSINSKTIFTTEGNWLTAKETLFKHQMLTIGHDKTIFNFLEIEIKTLSNFAMPVRTHAHQLTEVVHIVRANEGKRPTR